MNLLTTIAILVAVAGCYFLARIASDRRASSSRIRVLSGLAGVLLAGFVLLSIHALMWDGLKGLGWTAPVARWSAGTLGATALVLIAATVMLARRSNSKREVTEHHAGG